jgi:hypothetical protein
MKTKSNNLDVTVCFSLIKQSWIRKQFFVLILLSSSVRHYCIEKLLWVKIKWQRFFYFLL